MDLGMVTEASVLAERYEVGPMLGRGGMARVHAATDRLLGRTVAVKILAEPYDRDEAFVERFRREARAAARLNHPNIVAVYDTGSDGDAHFIVMERVRGRTLAEVIRDEAPLPPERVASVGRTICEALDAAHAAGLVHRDVKPGNVMITGSGEVKVMDFGIARAADVESVTKSGVVLGTAAYLSPEQAAGEPADVRSDLYALGCVLYEMLTARPPFEGETPVATLYLHVHERPEPPSRSVPVPPALEAVVLSLLSKDPSRRPGSAREVAGALERAIGDHDATAPLGASDPIVLSTEPAPATPPPARAGEAERTRPLEPLPGPAVPPRRAVPVVLGALAMAVGLLLLWSLLAPGERRGAAPRSEGRRDAGPTRAATPPPADVAAAFAGLVQAIVEGREAGEIEDGFAEDLLNRAEEVLDRYREADAEEVAKKSEGFLEELAKGAEEGEVEPSRADRIHEAFDAMVALMAREPPVPEGDGEEGEEGGGGPPPHAEAKGHEDD